MKKLLIAFLLLFFVVTTGLFAQVDLNRVVNRSMKKAERNVENRVERRLDRGVDKVLDKTEEGIDETVKGDGKDKKKEEAQSDSKDNGNKSGSKSDNKQAADNTAPVKDETPAPQEPEKPKPALEWAKYDFVPGTEIIFEDNQEGEQNGEFPSKWDLAGGVVENAFFDNLSVIFFREIGNTGGITPLLKDSKSDYLPDEFTIEFDCYFEKEVYNQRYYVSFYAAKKQKTVLKRLVLSTNQAQYGTTDIQGIYPGASRSNIDKNARWRHIAISFNKRALKVYMDDARLLNIPNIEENPTGVTLGTTSQKTGYYFIKNIRIAKGAVPLYDKFLTDGKFVTTGIKFDVNKATIKPESMGTINYVVKMMQDHPELKFSVEGHTDSDGDDASNMKLSEARAKAVMDKLTELGIAKDRLTSKGNGESKPMAANDTPEGKAQNRRVEFVKF
ncbi:OmpA family [Lentimicrobium saccharophilum]|uniref:OmpA family n=1 Tax=Lentimicrobium saccharophilum TaxID=1678841 RepID=A0A0S7C3L7_9BACT|nr:OmpA family protein [Lentimicrobium saccharophilum]GAP43792.1 OmpA family [Lentimicrobium saccharophilum]